jgi:hypothetical protein
MARVLENYSKFEFRTVVKFFQAEGLSQREIHRRLVFTARKFSEGRKCLCK